MVRVNHFAFHCFQDNDQTLLYCEEKVFDSNTNMALVNENKILIYFDDAMNFRNLEVVANRKEKNISQIFYYNRPIAF